MGLYVDPSLIKHVVFAQWMNFDVVLLHATIKFGKYEWRHQPLVAKDLVWIILAGYSTCLSASSRRSSHLYSSWRSLGRLFHSLAYASRHQRWFNYPDFGPRT